MFIPINRWPRPPHPPMKKPSQYPVQHPPPHDSNTLRENSDSKHSQNIKVSQTSSLRIPPLTRPQQRESIVGFKQSEVRFG